MVDTQDLTPDEFARKIGRATKKPKLKVVRPALEAN